MKSLLELYKEHEGKVSDKWSLYLTEYDRLFHSYRTHPVRLLEIGIQNGGSLELWSKYFADAEHLIGCDINLGCTQLSYEDQRISVIVADANTDEAFQRIVDRTSSFDLIIDDGSHTSSDIVKSFSRYFPTLKEGGLFIAEDLHCSYWQEFEGGLYMPQSSIAFFKRLADIVNFEHWGHARDRAELLKEFSEHYGVAFDETSLAQIHSVAFINSMCVIEKKKAEENLLGSRFIAGKIELVVPGHADFAGTTLASPGQSNNRWSALERAPDELWESCLERVRAAEYERGLSLNKIAELESQLEAARNTSQERIGTLEGTLQEIVSSTSWKVTAPLRKVGAGAKLARRLQSSARQSLALHGVQGTASKLADVLKREGLPGIRRRLAPREQYAPAQDYAEWVRRFDTISEADRSAITSRIDAMPNHPRISVVMPAYNPPLELLDEAIWSVRKQLYPFWELCIADDASTHAGVKQLLTKHAEEDDRIKLIFRSENGHISKATNSALSLATGEYIALLDNDDLLTEHALYWVAEAIIENPDSALLYSDEDKLSVDGERFGPYFKCEYNPELMLAHNMICHLGVYRKDIIDHIGGFRTGVEGAQDYDLALRALEQLRPDQIVHIPRILYHWRAIPGSTALTGASKDYAAEAGRRAVVEHLQRLGIDADVTPAPAAPGMNRVRYKLPDALPKVSIIIPTRDRIDLLSVCIESIRSRSTYAAIEIIVVDNGSTEVKTAEYLNTLKADGIKVIHSDEPFNFSRLNNLGALEATGEILCLMNNDIEITVSDWLEEMVSYVCRSEIGCVGARLLYPDGRLQHGGVILGIGGVAGHSHKYASRIETGYFGRAALHQSLSAVTAACLLVRKDVFDAVDGLDESFAIAFNDVDFCLRVRAAGYRNVWTPYAEMIHHESVSRGREDNPEKIARFNGEVSRMIERWGDALLNDPAYSPNLTLDHEDFGLAWPPRIKSTAL